MHPPLVDVYVARLVALGRDEAIDRAALERALAGAVSEGRAAWPKIALGEHAFVEHLAARVAPGDVPSAHAADLWLACACACGIAGAVEAFERAHAAEVRAVHAQSRGSARPALDDLEQTVSAKLFVGDAPKIADYAGSGPLKAWVRVVASRALVDMTRARANRNERPGDDDGMLAVPSPGDDPEIEYLKRTYRHEMRAAFEEAARALSPEERNVLRDHYARRMGIDEIAAAHGIHRASAARRIERAREAVLRGTRQRLMQRLKMSRGELESAVRLIESQLHVSVERVFGSRSG